MVIRRRWPWVLGIIVSGLGLVVVTGLIVVFVFREDPGAKSVDEALEEFRSESDPTSSLAEAIGPPRGVYLASGEGNESISFPPLSQRDSVEMPASIVHRADGCWTFTLDYNEAHWQSWDYCTRVDAGTIEETGGQTYQRWDLGAVTIENLTTFVCEPAVVSFSLSAQAGDGWEQSCSGSSTQIEGGTVSAGRYELIGAETIVIGGESVPAHRYRRQRTLSGSQNGTLVEDIWMAVPHGLPLRAERTIAVSSSSPVGNIEYEESGRWELLSRSPIQ